MNDKIIAHIKSQDTMPANEWYIQSNEEHCKGVAKLAALFANEFDCADWGYIIGLLHDKGKEKKDFQNYIQKISGYNINVPTWEDKTHAYVGALLAKEIYGPLSLFLNNPIAGHHTGLYDYDELENKMKSDIPSEINKDIEKINLEIPLHLKKSLTKSDFHHFIRLLYSCLVDADFLDTENFMNEGNANLRGPKENLQQLSVKLKTFLATIKVNAKDSPVNRIRNVIQRRCLETSGKESGFYSLTVPTGGGKTISSLVWAINHALKHSKRRIIIAIPYTSIIVQTAEVLRNIFGDENVLEHHSNANQNKIKDPQLALKMKLATENWDYPIIVTTNVQLFESIFSNKPSSCRKLHNICNSILILDEIQTLPLEYLQPIVDALRTYQRCFRVSVLFTTASLPALEGSHKGSGLSVLKGLENIHEIIPQELCLHDKLRRVSLEFDKTKTDHKAIAQRLAQHNKVLCIVNTRKDAQEIYSRLPQEGLTLHLSRMMCPKHLSETISLIKHTLKDNSQTIIRVIATQLIEAGVDIDFPIVYRQEAGLDSILQAAGRCNREGNLNISTTYVFKLNKALPAGYIANAAYAQNTLLRTQVGADWFSPTIMNEYFIQLYSRTNSFDKKNIEEYLYNPCNICFDTAAQSFHLIENGGKSIIVNFDNSLSLVEKLKQEGPNYSLMKQLLLYTVNVREQDFKKLNKTGFIEEIIEGIYLIPDRCQYNEKVGLVTENHWLEEILIK